MRSLDFNSYMRANSEIRHKVSVFLIIHFAAIQLQALYSPGDTVFSDLSALKVSVFGLQNRKLCDKPTFVSIFCAIEQLLLVACCSETHKHVVLFEDMWSSLHESSYHFWFRLNHGICDLKVLRCITFFYFPDSLSKEWKLVG